MDTKKRLEIMDEIEAANKKHLLDWKKQQPKQIRGVLVDVKNGTVTDVTVDKTLDSYYSILNCRCIDIVRRTVAGKPFEIICDDEGMLVDDPIPSAVNVGDQGAMLFGNLLVVAFDGVDDVRSLTDDEVAHVLKNAITITNFSTNSKRAILANVCYR